MDDELHRGLARSAQRRGVSLSDAVRAMLAAQIEVEDGNAPSLRSLHAAVLACLLSSELAVRLIVSILPRGEEESVKQLEEAANSARRRLEQVELGLSEGGDRWRG